MYDVLDSKPISTYPEFWMPGDIFHRPIQKLILHVLWSLDGLFLTQLEDCSEHDWQLLVCEGRLTCTPCSVLVTTSTSSTTLY